MVDIEIETGAPSAAFEGIMIDARASKAGADASASLASAAQVGATAHALEADLSATAARTAGPVHASTAIGLAATVEGATFYVQGDGASTFMVLYRKTNGSAVKIADIAARAATTVLSVKSYGVLGGLPDETAAVQAALNAAKANAPCVLDFLGLDITFDVVSADGLANVELRGNGATIRPATQTGGRFVLTDATRIDLTDFKFVGQQSYNYLRPIDVQTGSFVGIYDCSVNGHGCGVALGHVDNFCVSNLTLRQIGMKPYPAALPDGPAGYGARFNIYGYGLRAEYCTNGFVDKGCTFENDTPASGCTSDADGGAGGFTSYMCANVHFHPKSVRNAPGQGVIHTGELQAVDIVAKYLAGTFSADVRGTDCSIDVDLVEGCNQEGATLFGMVRSRIRVGVSRNNRMTATEIWQCFQCSSECGYAHEETADKHPVANPAGLGIAHCVESIECTVLTRSDKSRNAGVVFAGSLNCRLLPGSQLIGFGAGNASDVTFRAGVSINWNLAQQRVASGIAADGVQVEPWPGVSAPDVFVSSPGDYPCLTRLDLRARSARVLTFAGYQDAISGLQVMHFVTSWAVGRSMAQPAMRAVVGDKVTITGANGVPILPVPSLSLNPVANDTYELTIAGAKTDDNSVFFSDRIRCMADGSLTVVNALGGGHFRGYAIAGGYLTLKMNDPNPTYVVRATGTAHAGAQSNV